MEKRKPLVLYDLSTVLLLAVLLLGAWLYGGSPEQNRVRQAAVNRGVDNVLGGLGASQLVLSYGGIDDDPAMNERVGAIFARVADAAREERDDLQYRISILRSKVPNAFSLPGGRNYITRGLVELLDDDEIAGVLGHELAHTVRRHGTKAFGRDLGMIVAANLLLDQVGDEEVEDAAQLAQIGIALVSTGYSRAAEIEADEVGLAYAVRAGYDPLGLAHALQKIETYQRENFGYQNEVPEFFRTHPLTEERVAAIRSLAKSMGFDVYVPGDPLIESLRRGIGANGAHGPGIDIETRVLSQPSEAANEVGADD